MKGLRTAILAVFLGCVAAGAASDAGSNGSAHDLDPPAQVRFTLADGVVLKGEATRWNAEGLDGSFGARRWSDLTAREAWDVIRVLLDRDDADQWILAGEALLPLPAGPEFAERAFAYARHADETCGERIDAARVRVREREAAAAARKAADAATRLRRDDPESRAWPVTPWPILSASQQLEAEASMLDDVAAVIPDGPTISQVRTDHLVVRGVLTPMESARLATTLERNLLRLFDLLGLPSTERPFWGLAAVLVTDDEEHFRMVQELAFGQATAPGEVAMCQFVGPKVFVIVNRDHDVERVLLSTSRELAHGLMHRLISPVRLPAWANEGIAEWAAGQLEPEPRDLVRNRQSALAFIRTLGNPMPIFELGYGSEPWRRVDPPASAIGRLTIELMAADRIDGLRAWIRAVKGGTPWREALVQRFGVSIDQLVQTTARYYTTND